jgi:hypothetical protein
MLWIIILIAVVYFAFQKSGRRGASDTSPLIWAAGAFVLALLLGIVKMPKVPAGPTPVPSTFQSTIMMPISPTSSASMIYGGSTGLGQTPQSSLSAPFRTCNCH